MIDWRQRSSDVLKTLGHVQKNVLETSSESIRRVAHSNGTDCWKDSVRAVEDVLKSGLKAQGELTTAAVDQIDSFVALPEPAGTLTHRVQQIIQDVTLAEAGLLANCSDLLRTIDPVQFVAVGRGFWKNPVHRMQRMTQEAVDRQMDLARGWTRARAEPDEDD